MAKNVSGKSKKKTPGPKKQTVKKKKNSKNENVFTKVAGAILLLLLFVIFSAILANRLVPPAPPAPEVVRKPVSRQPAVKKAPASPRHQKGRPTFEIYPGEEETAKPPVKKNLSGLPRVAIIIDDMGQSREMADRFAALDMAITFSILPNSTNHRSIAKDAHARGVEIMLHLPMEPMEYPRTDPGPGALLASMTPDALIEQLNRSIEKVPYVIGVNNHMGSKLTSISTRMYQVFSILKKRNLFFIDSRTTTESLCRPSARLLQLPFAQRDVFLDHVQTPEEVSRQIRRLMNIAKKNGVAIGIGHPHRVTFETLQKALPGLKNEVKFVKASKLVHPMG